MVESRDHTDDPGAWIDQWLVKDDFTNRAVVYFDSILRKIHVLSGSEVAELLDQAEDQISRAERRQIIDADLIVRGRRLDDQSVTYLLAQVSFAIGLEVVKRASQRARLLSKATGMPVIPVVGGHSIITEARELAGELGVLVFLDEDMQAE